MGREEEEERNERMQQLHNTAARCPLVFGRPLVREPLLHDAPRQGGSGGRGYFRLSSSSSNPLACGAMQGPWRQLHGFQFKLSKMERDFFVFLLFSVGEEGKLLLLDPFWFWTVGVRPEENYLTRHKREVKEEGGSNHCRSRLNF